MPNPAVSGMESLENLTDKTQRFLIAARDEKKRRDELQTELDAEQETLDVLLERRRQLEATVAELESRRAHFDDKVTNLIDAIGEIPLREIS